MPLEEKSYLGMDWGATNIGLALAHYETRIALPFGTLKNDTQILTSLANILKEENIGTIVIGIPEYKHRPDGLYGSEIFGSMLTEHFSVEIVYQNEMFTTKTAEANLREQGRKNVSKENDEESARIILQEWLDKKPRLS